MNRHETTARRVFETSLVQGKGRTTHREGEGRYVAEHDRTTLLLLHQGRSMVRAKEEPVSFKTRGLETDALVGL